MSLEHIDPYPWFLNKPLDLIVNEQLVRTRITASEWADSWRPFLGRLYNLFDAKLPGRFIVAIAGPPGSGKSVLAEQMHWIIERGFFHKKAASVALPMDGFHYPNSFLETHTRKLADGREISLSTVKGQPDTIDVKTLRRYLKALVARPQSMPWPGYSRFTHDVMPDKYHVHDLVNLVLVEGNYLLVDRGIFAGLPAMFDLRVYVDCPAPKIIANLVERHIRSGKELQDAKDWVKRIDLPNARAAEATKPNADVIIEKDTNEDVSGVTWKGEMVMPVAGEMVAQPAEAAEIPPESAASGPGESAGVHITPPAAAATPAPAPPAHSAVADSVLVLRAVVCDYISGSSVERLRQTGRNMDWLESLGVDMTGLRAGASEASIREVETVLGVMLPISYRNFLKAADGGSIGDFVFFSIRNEEVPDLQLALVKDWREVGLLSIGLDPRDWEFGFLPKDLHLPTPPLFAFDAEENEFRPLAGRLEQLLIDCSKRSGSSRYCFIMVPPGKILSEKKEANSRASMFLTILAIAAVVGLGSLLAMSYLLPVPEFDVKEYTITLEEITVANSSLICGDLGSKTELQTIIVPPGEYSVEATLRQYVERGGDPTPGVEIWPVELRLEARHLGDEVSLQDLRICSDSHYIYVLAITKEEASTTPEWLGRALKTAWKKASPKSNPVTSVNYDHRVIGYLLNTGEYDFPIRTARLENGRCQVILNVRGPDRRNSIAAPIAET